VEDDSALLRVFLKTLDPGLRRDDDAIACSPDTVIPAQAGIEWR
jgi:hypothetical protein